jgi:hypothetical protein
VSAIGVAGIVSTGPAEGYEWYLGDASLIDSNGVYPSLWAGTVA